MNNKKQITITGLHALLANSHASFKDIHEANEAHDHFLKGAQHLLAALDLLQDLEAKDYLEKFRDDLKAMIGNNLGELNQDIYKHVGEI